ncbi:MAG: putative membrane protein [Crocinitomicaceae bacterium]|jgi:putative membrane protein
MSTKSLEPSKLKKARIAIYVASFAIPVVVAVLFAIPPVEVKALKVLPSIYASINGLTAIILVAALIAIKKKNMNLHRSLMRFSLLLSILFLACYVAYHMTSESTSYEGDFKGLYFFILISHIILSVAVVPLVLFTYLFAWEGNFVRHKKWTKFTWPIWFYVAVTGVVVYVMISPFYGS